MLENLIKNKRIIGFGCCMMFFSSPGQTYFITLFSGEIRAELNLSHGQFGTLYSLATFASAFTLLKTGALLDRIPLRKFTLSVSILLAISCLLLAIAPNALLLLPIFFMLRHLGQGLMQLISATAVIRHVESAKAKATSLAGIGYSVAEAVLPTAMIALTLTVGWRWSWAIVGIFIAVFLPIAVHFLLLEIPQKLKNADEYSNSIENSGYSWTRKEALQDIGLYLFTPALIGQSFLYSGFMFHQVHLVTEKNWSILLWGNLYLLFAGISIISMLLTGALADRVGATKIVPFTTLPMILGLLALSQSDQTFVAVIFMLGMGFSSGAQAALTAPFFAERYGNKYFGAIKSLAAFIMVIMSSLSPILYGVLIDLGVTINSLALYSALIAISLAIIALIALQTRLAFPTQPQ